MNNPCAEIPLNDYMDGDFEVCQLAIAVDEIFAQMDDISNAAFTDVIGNKAWKTKKKNKKLWRSIDENWMPTKSELT